jgi:hypothetical protein
LGTPFTAEVFHHVGKVTHGIPQIPAGFQKQFHIDRASEHLVAFDKKGFVMGKVDLCRATASAD